MHQQRPKRDAFETGEEDEDDDEDDDEKSNSDKEDSEEDEKANKEWLALPTLEESDSSPVLKVQKKKSSLATIVASCTRRPYRERWQHWQTEFGLLQMNEQTQLVSSLRDIVNCLECLPGVTIFSLGKGNYSLIRPRLLLGDLETAINPHTVTKLGVTHIVSALPSRPALPAISCDLKHYHISVEDDPNADMFSHFDGTSDWITSALKSHTAHTVLVHCRMGVSRSSTLVIAHLMKTEGLSRRAAQASVFALRPCIKPNRGFQRQLDAYERLLTYSRDMWMELLSCFLSKPMVCAIIVLFIGK